MDFPSSNIIGSFGNRYLTLLISLVQKELAVRRVDSGAIHASGGCNTVDDILCKTAKDQERFKFQKLRMYSSLPAQS